MIATLVATRRVADGYVMRDIFRVSRKIDDTREPIRRHCWAEKNMMGSEGERSDEKTRRLNLKQIHLLNTAS